MLLPLRMLFHVPPKSLWKFVALGVLGSLRAIRKFEKRKARGDFFPPFLFISVTQRCNLACQGCWATGVRQPSDMSPEHLHAIITAGRSQGCRFFGILGGEPLLLPWLADFFASHADSYFQLFTNGHFLDDAFARKLRAAGNVSPLISIEGGAESYTVRRGDSRSYELALAALDICRRNGLVTGVATSVSNSTFEDVVNPKFVDEMTARGAHYIWYYIYRPSGPQPGFDEALDEQRVVTLRRFLLSERKRCRSAAIIDAYWDHDGKALCPAATGISHHINALGEIEPCPPIQFSDRRAGRDAAEAVSAITGSPFLKQFRQEVPGLTRGCILMDHPAELIAMAKTCGAHDSSGRETIFDEIQGRPVIGCHNHAGPPLPETLWAYRFAKKHCFFGFGAYG